MKNRDAWLTPYRGSVSLATEDRNRGAGLPSSITDQGYTRIVQGLEKKRAKQAFWHGVAQGVPVGLQPASMPFERQAGMQRTACAPEVMRKFAKLADVEAAGFKRIAGGMYRSAHDIWELRRGEGNEYELVRKREERAVDLRAVAGVGTQAAVDAGIVHRSRRRAQLGAPAMPMEADPMPMEADPMGGGGDPLALEPEGGDPLVDDLDGVPVGEGDFEADQAQEFFDAHEIVHGRDPVYNIESPLVMGLQELVGEDDDDGAGDDGNGDDDSDHDDGDNDDDGDDDPGAAAEDDGAGGETAAPFGGTARRRAVAPPGAKYERMVRDLKQDPGVDSPYAVAWSQYNKHEGGPGPGMTGPSSMPAGAPMGGGNPGSMTADPHCGAPDHGTPGHQCAQPSIEAATMPAYARLRGTKILAIRKGGVSEGTAIRMLPHSQLEADFGEGGEAIPLEMILEPLLEMLGLTPGGMHDHHEEPDGDECLELEMGGEPFGGDDGEDEDVPPDHQLADDHDHDHEAAIIRVRAEDLE